MTGSTIVSFSVADGSVIGGYVAGIYFALGWSAEFWVSCGLVRRLRTSDCRSCSSSESRSTIGICVGRMEGCVFTVCEGCVFTVGGCCIFTVGGIDFGV